MLKPLRSGTTLNNPYLIGTYAPNRLASSVKKIDITLNMLFLKGFLTRLIRKYFCGILFALCLDYLCALDSGCSVSCINNESAAFYYPLVIVRLMVGGDKDAIVFFEAL